MTALEVLAHVFVYVMVAALMLAASVYVSVWVCSLFKPRVDKA